MFARANTEMDLCMITGNIAWIEGGGIYVPEISTAALVFVSNNIH